MSTIYSVMERPLGDDASAGVFPHTMAHRKFEDAKKAAQDSLDGDFGDGAKTLKWAEVNEGVWEAIGEETEVEFTIARQELV